MYATEFQTIIKNGYIQIPNYERFKDREVRIIILDNIQEQIEKHTLNTREAHLNSFYAMIKKGKNRTKLTLENTIDTDGMIDDIL